MAMLAFGSTCRINSECLFVPLCSGQQKLSTLMLAYGGDLVSPPMNIGFASWVHQWATLIS